LVFVAVVLVLMGRGLGLFGNNGQPEEDPTDPGHDPVAPDDPVAEHESGVTTGSTVPRTDTVGLATPPAPSAAAHAENELVTELAGELAEGADLDGDRFASLLSLVQARCDRGEFGGALSVLERADKLQLDRSQRRAVQQASRDVEAAVQQACRDIEASLREGRVLAARELAGTMLTDGEGFVRPALAKALDTGASDLATVPARGDRPWPTAVPLPRDRTVRASLSDGPAAGRIVDSRSDQVTVRLQTPHGVTFPTLRITACEPVDATPAEAIEMGFAALHAGDAVLAHLWQRCARLRGEPPAERAGLLAEILR
jgi:hypothetical protein